MPAEKNKETEVNFNKLKLSTATRQSHYIKKKGSSFNEYSSVFKMIAYLSAVLIFKESPHKTD